MKVPTNCISTKGPSFQTAYSFSHPEFSDELYQILRCLVITLGITQGIQSENILWSHGEVFGLIWKAEHCTVPGLTRGKSARISPKLLELFPFTQISLIPVLWFSK